VLKSTAPSSAVAFIAHSFAAEDRPLVMAIKRTIRAAGFEALTGERAEARGVAEKVRARIDRAKVFIALLTRCHKVGDGAWTTNPWVIEEKGYFLGRHRSGRLIVLVEEGIAVPHETGGISGDLEYVPFDRFAFAQAQERVGVMLRNLRVRSRPTLPGGRGDRGSGATNVKL
jgi:Predicted nucleotide-binding protein containing TIR-like domain